MNVLVLKSRQGRVPLDSLLDILGRLRITSLLIEGGSELNAAAVREGLVDRVAFYVAPRLLGGQDAKGVIGGRSPDRLVHATTLTDVSVQRIGADLLIEGAVERSRDRSRNGS